MPDTLPVLLIPGLNCSARLFAWQIPSIQTTRAVYVADHTVGNTIEEIAQHILRTAPARFAMAGFSMGGYIAFEIMRQAADRVERLALLSTSAEAESAEQRKTRDERIARIAADEVGSWIEERFKQLVHPCRADDQDLLAIYRQMALFDNGRDAALRHLKAASDRANSISTLSMITCPALVAVGDSDHVTPVASARKMADGILNADLVVIPECGHLSPLEQPDGVFDCLSTWLKL